MISSRVGFVTARDPRCRSSSEPLAFLGSAKGDASQGVRKYRLLRKHAVLFHFFRRIYHFYLRSLASWCAGFRLYLF